MARSNPTGGSPPCPGNTQPTHADLRRHARPGLVNAYWACGHPLSAQSVDSATQQNRVQIRDELGQLPSRLLTGAARA